MLRRSQIAIASGVLTLLLASAPAATAAPSCSAGHTRYAKHGARIFYVERSEAIYGCARGASRPVLLVYDSLTYGTFSLLKRSGTIVPFLESTSGEGGGYENEFGWFDTRSGRHMLARPFGIEVELRVKEVAVARKGTTAVVSREPGSAPVISIHTVNAKGKLRGGRGLAFVHGHFAAGSLKVAGTTVSWRDGDGARSVTLSGEPLSCTAGRTKLAAGDVRIFETIEANRGVMHWCGPAVTEPQPLPEPKFNPFELLPGLTAAPETAGRVAFHNEYMAGVVDGGAVRAVANTRDLAAVKAGPKGELIAAFDEPAGGYEGGILVAPPAATGFALEKPHLVASYVGALVKDSLTVTGDTISWRTTEGARSVPIGGETEVTCQAGTTVREQDGARLFQFLDVQAGKRTLYVCPPGGTPLSLFTQPIDDPFAAWLFGIANGRGVVARWGRRESDPDDVVTFATTQDSLRRGQITDDRTIAVIAMSVAPDGAVAFLFDLYGGEVEAQYMAPTATGLAGNVRVKRAKGGYKARSLGIGDTTISWQSKAGATRSVARP